jgi:hypothetical protein
MKTRRHDELMDRMFTNALWFVAGAVLVMTIDLLNGGMC